MFSPYAHPAPACVLHLSANLNGRDFVVGDIHGSYNTVLAAMKAANFDGSRDRLFSVGDLIDRGRDSWRCAAFLAQPYVYAILGNHEDMLLDLYKDGEFDEAVLRFMASRSGFGWWLDTPREKRAEIIDALRKLPNVIELETARGTVGLVHADIPAGMNWQTFVAKLEAGDPDVRKTSLWGRERIQGNNMDGVEGIGRVFVGHTIEWNGLKRRGNVYCIDTGSIHGEEGRKEGGRLTFANMACKTGLLEGAPPKKGLFDVRDNPEGTEPDALGPFGTYARPYAPAFTAPYSPKSNSR